jgi:hypothetical protein
MTLLRRRPERIRPVNSLETQPLHQTGPALATMHVIDPDDYYGPVRTVDPTPKPTRLFDQDEA